MTSAEIEIWHNPRCTKSRQALAWLTERGHQPQVRLYLQDAPTLDDLRAALAALGRPAADLLRPDGKALRTEADETILSALAENPALIERPVVFHGGRADIARPTEALESLFG